MLNTAIKKFIRMESASGILLGVAALLALTWANSPWSSIYFDVLSAEAFGVSLRFVINDGLMTVFFLLIGMEIKREIVAGELRTWRKAALPVVAAIGGMLVPALIYLSLNQESENARGWAIPMATDIAFALGALSLFGRRVPLALKVFLLTLAVVDDLGAVLAIALFYTDQIHPVGLGLAGLAVGLVFLLRKLKHRSPLAFLSLGILLWWGIHQSGVHATIAGIVLGFLVPRPALDKMIGRLHPWVSFLIMPLFALANAGIVFPSDVTRLDQAVALGVMLGLVMGKPLGILLAAIITVKFGWTERPRDLSWAQLSSVACLGGIGFTMAIFVSNLALGPAAIDSAKIGVMVGSAVSAVLGLVMLQLTLRDKGSD